MAKQYTALSTHQVGDEAALAGLLDQVEAQLQELHRRGAQLSFDQYQSRERSLELEQVETLQAELMSTPQYQALVNRFAGRVIDPLLARRLGAWQQAFRGARVSGRPAIRRLVSEISDYLLRHRYVIGGQELGLSAVRHILRTDPDRQRRREAWHAFAPLSQALAGRTRELFALRNEAAREEGFPTYVEMQLDAQGLTQAQVEGALTSLAGDSATAYQQVLEAGAERHGLAQIEPWDLRFLLEGQGTLSRTRFPRTAIEPRLHQWAQLHGFDLNRLGISVHFLEIPYNGLCIGIHPRDIRILGNPTDGLSGHKTSFHELGHALHSAHSDPGSFILRREPSVFSEAMAELLGYVVLDPEWLAHQGLSDAEVEAAEREAVGAWFAYLRLRSAHALFEYRAYADPRADLDRVCGEVEAAMLGCTFDPTPRWAGEPNAWYSRYPVYWQNYVLADLVASQIAADLRRRFGGLFRRPEAVAYLKVQYWAPGGAVDWQEKLRRGTGQGLDAAALVADLNRVRQV